MKITKKLMITLEPNKYRRNISNWNMENIVRSKKKCNNTDITLEKMPENEQRSHEIDNYVKLEINDELNTEDYVVTASDGNIDHSKNIESILQRKIKLEDRELNTEQVVDGNVVHPFAFVSVNDRNLGNFYEIKVEENEMNPEDILEIELKRNGKYNVTDNEVISENAGVNIKSEPCDLTEDYNDNMCSVNSVGSSVEVKVEEHEIKLEETCENEQSSSSEDVCGSGEISCETENNDLNQHVSIHSEEKPFCCNICNKKFTRNQYLQVHIRIHSGQKPYCCEICDKKFMSSSNLQVHMRIHSGEKPFTCKICDKKFTQKHTLKVHMRAHSGENLFSCKICDKKYMLNHALQVHMRTHSGERPFSCKICNKNFTLKHVLQVHMLTHSEEKPFNCSVCDKKFTINQNLQIHMRLHSGEKPFCCNICDRKFTSNAYLQAHIRTHSEEKPFNCKICGKRFKQNRTLQTHMMVHSGERPFSCKICDKTFARKNYLKTHMLIHSKQKNSASALVNSY